MEFECVTPAGVTALRAYAFVKNDDESGPQAPAVGWHTAHFYAFTKSAEGPNEYTHTVNRVELRSCNPGRWFRDSRARPAASAC